LPWKNHLYRIEADPQFTEMAKQNARIGPSARTGPNQTDSTEEEQGRQENVRQD